MPKTKFQNVIFTLLMAFAMVYAMICYNIAINRGGMTNEVFMLAFHEVIIMWPVALCWKCSLWNASQRCLPSALSHRMISRFLFCSRFPA